MANPVTTADLIHLLNQAAAALNTPCNYSREETDSLAWKLLTTAQALEDEEAEKTNGE